MTDYLADVRKYDSGADEAIVKKIVEDHGGRLELYDALADYHGGGGAMVSIVLPAAAAENERNAEPARMAGAAENGQVVHGV